MLGLTIEGSARAQVGTFIGDPQLVERSNARLSRFSDDERDAAAAQIAADDAQFAKNLATSK